MRLEIYIPTSLNDILLKDFQSYWATERTDNDKLLYLLKLTQPTIDALPLKTFEELVGTIDKLLMQEVEFIDRFYLQDVEYGFIPNLEEITTKEFVDVDTFLNDIDTLHIACAVLYRPIVKENKGKFDIAPYLPTVGFEEVMKFMPLGVALGAKVFFWNLGKELIEIIPSVLEKQVKEMSTVMKHNSVNVGDGTQV